MLLKVTIPLLMLASLAALGEAYADEPSKQMDLFLLIGQSNMAGRGVPEPPDREPVPGIFTLNKDSQWIPAVDPLHFDKPQIAGVGLGRSFAKALRAANLDRQIGLIPAAFGGSSLEQWTPGGELYSEALRRTREALKSGRLRGILWHQGEADSAREDLANSYAARWMGFIAALRKDLGAPDTPVVVGELGRFLEHDKQPFAAIVNQQLESLSKRVPHTAFVSSQGLADKGDHLHFDSASQREFGTRYAAAYRKLNRERE